MVGDHGTRDSSMASNVQTNGEHFTTSPPVHRRRSCPSYSCRVSTSLACVGEDIYRFT